MTLAEIKRRVQAGQVYDVTNHFITRQDHASFGTTRRVVTGPWPAASTCRWRPPTSKGHAKLAREIDWPKASQVQMDDDGVIRLYGGGAGQDPSDLFLTLVPVKNGVHVRSPTAPIRDTTGAATTPPATAAATRTVKVTPDRRPACRGGPRTWLDSGPAATRHRDRQRTEAAS